MIYRISNPKYPGNFYITSVCVDVEDFIEFNSHVTGICPTRGFIRVSIFGDTLLIDIEESEITQVEQ